MSLIGILLKSTCRNAQRPEESCQYGYCKLENLIPFLLVLFCHNLFCFKRLIIQVLQVQKLKELKELSLPTVAEELRQ